MEGSGLQISQATSTNQNVGINIPRKKKTKNTTHTKTEELVVVMLSSLAKVKYALACEERKIDGLIPNYTCKISNGAHL